MDKVEFEQIIYLNVLQSNFRIIRALKLDVIIPSQYNISPGY